VEKHGGEGKVKDPLGGTLWVRSPVLPQLGHVGFGGCHSVEEANGMSIR
jgi:hypothetical protein